MKLSSLSSHIELSSCKFGVWLESIGAIYLGWSLVAWSQSYKSFFYFFRSYRGSFVSNDLEASVLEIVVVLVFLKSCLLLARRDEDAFWAASVDPVAVLLSSLVTLGTGVFLFTSAMRLLSLFRLFSFSFSFSWFGWSCLEIFEEGGLNFRRDVLWERSLGGGLRRPVLVLVPYV